MNELHPKGQFSDWLNLLEANGFDRCEPDEGNDQIGVGCSQCEALVINGVATHEHGCPNGYKAILQQEQEEREALEAMEEEDG